MQKGTYVAPVSHYEGEEDDGGWTVIDKKTKEVEARLAKKKQQKKAAQTAGQKQAAEIKKEAKLDTTTLFSTFQELMDRKEQEKVHFILSDDSANFLASRISKESRCSTEKSQRCPSTSSCSRSCCPNGTASQSHKINSRSWMLMISSLVLITGKTNMLIKPSN